MTTAIIIGVALVIGFVLGIWFRPDSDFETKQDVTDMGDFSFLNDEWPAWKGETIALKREIIPIEKKVNLILKELGKEYQPARDVHEEAKLVDKQIVSLPSQWGICGTPSVTFSTSGTNEPTKKPAKKTTKKKKK